MRQRPTQWLILGAMMLFVAGCASPVTPMIDANLTAFENGVNAVLKNGMSIKEARSALRTQFPPPSLNSELVPPIPTLNRSLQNRRYLVGWPTTTPGTTLTVTLFCDRDGRVVRWTMGTLEEQS